jgi:hypothetical protein
MQRSSYSALLLRLIFYFKFRKKSLKGLCREINTFLKICRKKHGLSVHVHIVFTTY